MSGDGAIVNFHDDSAHMPKLVTLQDFMQMDLPQREAILSPVMLQQSLGMIHAYRGIGKTYLAMCIGYAVASGGTTLGWNAPKPRGVLYLDGEMPAPALQERFAAIIAASDKELKAPLRIMTPDLQPMGDAPFNLAFPEDQDALEFLLLSQGIELIIVDNLATLARVPKSNDSESWQPVQTWALKQRAAGRSVLFVHHSGKSGLQRGTSAKEDVLDYVIGLRRPPDYEPRQGCRFELHYEKCRGLSGEDADPIEAMMTIDQRGRTVWAVKPLEDSLFEQVIDLHKEGLSLTEIGQEVGRHKSNVSRMVRRAKDEGRI
jgi:putative DNA primase/helicase